MQSRRVIYSINYALNKQVVTCSGLAQHGAYKSLRQAGGFRTALTLIENTLLCSPGRHLILPYYYYFIGCTYFVLVGGWN